MRPPPWRSIVFRSSTEESHEEHIREEHFHFLIPSFRWLTQAYDELLIGEYGIENLWRMKEELGKG